MIQYFTRNKAVLLRRGEDCARSTIVKVPSCCHTNWYKISHVNSLVFNKCKCLGNFDFIKELKIAQNSRNALSEIVINNIRFFMNLGQTVARRVCEFNFSNIHEHHQSWWGFKVFDQVTLSETNKHLPKSFILVKMASNFSIFDIGIEWDKI